MKSAFRFKLQKLLEHKSTLEDIAKREWVEAQTAVDEENEVLTKMYSQIDESRAWAAGLEKQGGAQAAVLSQTDLFINGHKIRIEHQRLKIRELMTTLEEKHEALIEAARERKTLEKLKENQLAEHKLKLKKQDLKRIDELVTTRFKVAGDPENG